MTSPAPVYQLALREFHAAAGATFGVHAGWALPLSYVGTVNESEQLRSAAVVFDRSNRSRILITGTDALDVLQTVFAGHIEDLDEGRAMRSVSVGEDGSISDLVLIARTGGIAYFVSGEPGQRFGTLERLQEAVQPDYDVHIEDRTETTCLIGLAGPMAVQAVQEHLAEALPARLQPLHCVTFEFHGFRALAVRTSDTGEDGFEFLVAPAVAQHILETLRQAGIALAGLQSLEIARIEACVPAFEPDLSPGLSPAEADLDALLDVPGGREGRILSALLFEDAVEPAGSPLVVSGAVVGEVRSAVRSPGLNASIGLGILAVRYAFPGQAVQVGAQTATIVAKPFFRRRT
ncbi:MAG: glycine cleavage T C-terminal barrel domain-containing protein [Tepidiformaceae bacterium]